MSANTSTTHSPYYYNAKKEIVKYLLQEGLRALRAFNPMMVARVGFVIRYHKAVRWTLSPKRS